MREELSMENPMSIQEFIDFLSQKEINVSFSGGKLKYSGPQENLTPELIENLVKYKGKLIKHFWPRELYNLMPINPEGTKKPLFVVHGDKGNYLISDKLGPDQPLYGFFHPGSEGEKIKFRSVEEMAGEYLKMVLNVSPEGPFYLIGFSFGGVLAYEMAIQLKNSGYDVPFLVIIDSISPLAKLACSVDNAFFSKIRSDVFRPLRKKIRRFFKIMICNLYATFNKPIPLSRRNYYMWDKYLGLTRKYSPNKFDGEILLFRTTENPSPDKYLGWDSLVNKINMHEIEGKHLEIFTGERRTEILQDEIAKYLESVNEKIINKINL
jgi:thioesterase domain-containing protein